jgi:hypothetical protein
MYSPRLDAGAMSVTDGQSLLKFFEQGIEGYTYLE